MKSFKDILESTLELDDPTDELQEDETFYKVGDGVKFTIDDVGRANPGKQVTFDYGVIVKKVGKDYIVKLDNGEEVKVLNKQAYATPGNADATPVP